MILDSESIEVVANIEEPISITRTDVVVMPFFHTAQH